MSCEMRSMITSYCLGSSIRIPPILTNSDRTPSTRMELIFSTTAGGNVFSIPKMIPILFMANSCPPWDAALPAALPSCPPLTAQALKRIGIIFGMENTFPPAVVEKINSMGVDGVRAEFVKIGGIRMDEPKQYDVIIDRISQDIAFYRAYLKNAALHGTVVINNPFWWTADDKFFNYALATKLGVAIPPTVVLPHNQHPPGTTDQSMRNLMFPLNWDEVFAYVGWPAFLKPYDGGGWKHVYKLHSPEEFFKAYNETGTLCMTLQRGVEFQEYFRCYVIGQEKVHIMRYDPKAPHHERYVKGNPAPRPELKGRMEKD